MDTVPVEKDRKYIRWYVKSVPNGYFFKYNFALFLKIVFLFKFNVQKQILCLLKRNCSAAYSVYADYTYSLNSL